MRFPSATAYLEALQHPASCFADPELARGTPALGPLGLPRAWSGNVAVVFRMDCPGGSYAVRCFVRSLPHAETRYAAISAFLRGLRSSWQLDVEYLADGIQVGGAWWPVVKMGWAPAEPLLSYVERHLWDGVAMAGLAARFSRLAEELRTAGVAHGDLQHGNVLVAPTGDLRLLDYDGMYVPGLEGLPGVERGHRNYQHPRRRQTDFGPGLDHFASWVIYTSLTALAGDPLLWGRLDGGDECLLLRKRDLDDPERSAALAALAATGDGSLASLTALLRSFLAGDPGAVPPLSPTRTPAAPPREEVGTAELSERQHLVAALRGVDAAAGAPAPSPAELPGEAVEPVPFQGRLSGARAGLAGALALVGLVALLTATGVLAPAAGAVAVLAVVGAALAHGNRLYLGSEEVQRARAVEADLAQPRQRAAAARAVVDDLSRRRADVDAEEAATAQQVARVLEQIGRLEDAELRAEADELQEALASVAAQEQELSRSEHRAWSSALAALRQEALDAQLARWPLTALVVPAMTDKVLYALALDGIRTAADFVDVVVEDDGTALVVHRDGRKVRVSGVGRAQAHAMMAWRRTLESRAQPSLPRTLPGEQEAAVRGVNASRRAALAAMERAARAAAARRAGETRSRWHPQRERLEDQLRQAQAEATKRRLELDGELARARKDAVEAAWRVDNLERRAAAYRTVTRGHYLRRVMGR